MSFSWAGRLTPCGGRLPLAALVVSAALLAGCSVTGQTFNTGGLDRIVVGRTTLQQAAQDLGAQPTNVWQQGDSLLARWGYTGTVATDAVYFRQEVWLRFGPDGTFQRVENSVNLPMMHHPRTAEEADREAAQARDRTAAAQGKPMPVAGQSSTETGASEPIPVSSPPPIVPASPGTAGVTATPAASGVGPAQAATPMAGADVPSSQPLLPAGTQVVPGTSYDLRPKTP
ncbi:hypothetical protein [Castellaniella sp. MT123]|uniref:hypothetical protein n=1 Tax=Castellaniella sp. MT123 TaxID=3140381 RepID=UPI0031F41301